jgi:hypothetical protein
VTAATLASVVRASLRGDTALFPETLIADAAASIVADHRFTQKGFDNVLSRVAPPANRQRRLA